MPVGSSRNIILKPASPKGAVLANSLIFCLLGLRWLNYGYFPLSNLYESLLFLAWGITFTTILLEYKSSGEIADRDLLAEDSIYLTFNFRNIGDFAYQPKISEFLKD